MAGSGTDEGFLGAMDGVYLRILPPAKLQNFDANIRDGCNILGWESVMWLKGELVRRV